MDKTAETTLVAGIDVARDREEIAVLGWTRVGHAACYMDVRLRKFGWSGGRPIRSAMSRPWLKQKKGRGVQL